MSSPIPLTYKPVQGQVAQFIEGGDPAMYTNAESPLSTIGGPGTSETQ